MLVVACNTATAAALPSLQERLPIPVIGVVEPGARRVERTRGRSLIATEGTVRSKRYTRAIHKLDAKIEVIESAAPLFVSLAEEGWRNTHVAPSCGNLSRAAARCRIDTLVSDAPTTRSCAARSSRWWEGFDRRQRGDHGRMWHRHSCPAGRRHREAHIPRDRCEERFRRIASEFWREIEHWSWGL